MKTERKDFYPTYGKMSYFNSPGGMDGLFLQTTHLPCGLDYGWACWFHRGVLEWVNGLLYLHTKGKFKNTWKQGPVLTHVSINWSYTRGSWVCIRTCRESKKVKSLSRVWLFAIPWTVASSIHGIFQQEYWSGLPLPSPEDLPDPGIKPGSPTV